MYLHIAHESWIDEIGQYTTAETECCNMLVAILKPEQSRLSVHPRRSCASTFPTRHHSIESRS